MRNILLYCLFPLTHSGYKVIRYFIKQHISVQYLFIYLAALYLSCDTWTLVALIGLCCSVHVGILIPRAEMEQVSPALQNRFLTTGPPVKSQAVCF